MTLKTQVREGRLVLDDRTDLPEGTEVELTPVLDDDLGPEERQALEASLARSAAQLARDELVDAQSRGSLARRAGSFSRVARAWWAATGSWGRIRLEADP